MPRQTAAHVLERIEQDDAYSHILLSSALDAAGLEGRNRGLATELVYGTLTWQRTLDEVLAGLLSRPLHKLDPWVRVQLRMALYQLRFLDRIPPHAAVDEAVRLTRYRQGEGAAKFVNAVLRRATALTEADWTVWQEEDRQKRPARYLGLRYSLPNWLANRLAQGFGIAQGEAWAQALTTRAPVYLRALGPDAFLESPVDIAPVEGLPEARRLMGSFGEPLRKGLDEARWTVQDLGSQLVGWFTEAQPGERVLDAACGLGGKTLQLARMVGGEGRVTGVDPLAAKLTRLKQTLDKLGWQDRATLEAMTLQQYERMHHELGRPLFDRVLVDAPCTGLGVLRRHPETRWRRQEADITRLARLQRELLEAAADLVRPGGMLIYSVCTFTAEEGPRQIESFLKAHPDFAPAPAPTGPPGLAWSDYLDPHHHLRTTPLVHDADAFFAARLIRVG